MATRIFGSGIKRREDPRLITGKATYTDDIRLFGTAIMVVVRSPYAHAKIKSIDTSKAAALPGVVAVYTGADTEGVVAPCAWLIPGSDLKTPVHPALAKDKVRYVGDGVAVVIAEDRYTAYDAADLVEVDYEELPAVVSPEDAAQSGAPQLFDDVPNNIAFRWIMNPNQAGLDQAFAEADHVIKERIVQQRLLPTAMEPRAALAQWNSGSNELTVWCTSQNPHIHRFIISSVLGVPEHKVRVIAPEVGGGFGSKIPCYPDELLAGWAAMKLNRPIRWSETRSENYITTIHGRDHVEYVEMAIKAGKVTAVKGVVYAGMGAYLSTAAPGIPTILHGLMYSGAYDIANVYCESIGTFTNTTPTDAYRGAGRPEATFLVERLMEKAANTIGMDPVEFRRKNLIPKFENHTVATGIIYDSGDYIPALDKALAMVDYASFRKEQEAARQQGRYMGIGVTTYTEICGLGPSQVAGAIGFQGGLWESAIIRVSPLGKVQALMGISPHGQGEETTFAQLVSEELGFPVEDIEIVHGDTNTTPMGWGTYGSRTTPVAGAALVKAARKLKEKARALAAHLLEAAVEDIDYDNGKFYVKGSPDKAKTIQEITLMAHLAWSLPPGMDPSFEESQFYDPPNFVYPFGTHIAVVEIDPETGKIDLKRYVAVDDCGPQINPMIVEGQIHGGIVQGAAQALCEGVVYDENGQLLTGSMMDYTMPRADMFPQFELDSTVTPSPHHPVGIKGVGETGTIASTPAVYNAIMDALRLLGVTEDIPMPATPARVWAAIHQKNGH
jgi:carbon-monoxide dehydrogenase large subunit